jgi:hypothetical protein
MELDETIVTNIDKLIDEWIVNDKSGQEMEMEAVFGEDGVVDASTFMSVAQRLQGKGFTAVSQDDRLSIIVPVLPSDLRFSIEGLGVLPILQDYCRTDRIQGKPFTVLCKSRHSPANKLNIEDYNFYLKNRIEERVDPADTRVTSILENWAQVDKAFRLIKRWTFKGKGMRIDMSMVRSTPSLNGKFLWQKRFQERDLFKAPVRYEIEVELQRDEHTKDKKGALLCLVRGVGEILRAMQKNTFLITVPESERVKSAYTSLNKSSSFRGVQPITMEVKHMLPLVDGADDSTANVRRNYNVTDKADGLRVLAYCNAQGELYLIDGGMAIYKTGLINKACYDCLLDGEWVTRTKDDKAINYVLLFDIYYLHGNNVSGADFYVEGNTDSRYLKMREWMGLWDGDSDGGVKMTVRGMTPASKFQVKLKHFEFCNVAQPNTIFARCATILNTSQIYETDGLILSPNTGSLPTKSGDTFWEQFKWKPSDMNTIDFLVLFDKKRGSKEDKVEIGDLELGGKNGYKTLRLYVGSEKDPAYDDPRSTVLNELPLPQSQRSKQRMRIRERRVYQPSLFIPADYPDPTANTCHLPVHINEETGDQYVETEKTQEPIQENMIVEMRYDPSRPAGWRWIPIRIRHDKTERFAKAVANQTSISRTVNSELNANGVWNSIHNPISVTMITTGAEKPTFEELAAYSRKKRYYNREASAEDIALVRGLRDFHNLWIKDRLLYLPTLSPGGKTVIDYSCGPGGDLRFWNKYKASFVLGADIDENNIRDNKQGIYRRYMNYLVDFGRDKVAPMVFVQADSTLPLIKGEAAISTSEKDRTLDQEMLKAIFARERADLTTLPALITKKANGILKAGADVGVSMFTLHYFLESEEKLSGFLNNLKDTIKIGGYFIGCCSDGEEIFKLLKDKDTGEAAVGTDRDVLIWSVTKGYDAEQFRADETSVGLPVDIKFISIGTEHTEYLVNFTYFQKRMDEIGFTLLTPDELKEMPGGLRHSTNLFKTSYSMVPNAIKEYPMTEEVQTFSFLSRWFIFKHRGEILPTELLETVVSPKKSLRRKKGGDGEAEEEEEEDEEDLENEEQETNEEPINELVGGVKSNLPSESAVFNAADIFQFGAEVGLKDPLKVGDDRSPKILAPYWPWPIKDEEDETEYPSLEHYWEAMKLKHGAGKPELAIKLLSKSGSIHQHALAQMKKDGIKLEPTSKADKAKLTAALLEELIDIKNIMSPGTLKKDYKATVDDAAWNKVKDYHYRRGLELRFKKDVMFRKIVDEAKKERKYLLFYRTKKTGEGGNELSGKHGEDGRIQGENKIGRLLMEIAHFIF